MKKIYLILILGILILSSSGYAYMTKPSYGLWYWNFTGSTDYWSSVILSNTGGATTALIYPSYNISGSSKPNSFNFTTTGSDYLQKTAFSTLASYTTFSENFWVYLKSYTGTQGAIISTVTLTNGKMNTYINSSSPYNIYYFGQYVTGPTTRWRIYSNVSISLNKWYMITVSCDKGNSLQKIYVNGTLVAKGNNAYCAGDVAGASNSFYVGRDNAGDYLNGYVDEVSRYSTALTQTQINRLYNYGDVNNITMADYTITSPVYGSATGWQTAGRTVTVTSNVLSGTFTTNLESNCSISKYNLNYDNMVSNWSAQKMATTNTKSFSFTYPWNLTNGTQSVYIACKSMVAGLYENSSWLNVTRILTARWSPIPSNQATTAGAQKNYTVHCEGFPTTMTYSSSNLTTAVPGSTISSSTGNLVIVPSFAQIGNRTISLSCNNGYVANASTFKLITGQASGGGGGGISCTQFLHYDAKNGTTINYNLTVECFNSYGVNKSVTITPPTGFGSGSALSLTASAYSRKSFYNTTIRAITDGIVTTIAGSSITGDLTATTNTIKKFIPIDIFYAYTKVGADPHLTWQTNGNTNCSSSSQQWNIVNYNLPYNLTLTGTGTFFVNASLQIKGFRKDNLCTMFIKPPGQLYIKH